MPKEEWGVKRVCPTTGKRFYDLNRTPIISPYTGEMVDIENPNRKISSIAAARPDTDKADKGLVDDLESDDDLLDDDDSSDDSNLDEDLLDDDEDDTVSLDDIADVGGEDDEN